MFPRNLPPFLSVPATGDAIIPVLPQGMTYNGILLTLGGTFTKAMISGIYLTLGGKEIWNGISGTHLDTINSYYKMATDATHLFLPFSDKRAIDTFGYDVGGIDTSIGYSDFQLKVSIAGATSPTLSAIAYVSPAQPRDAQYKGMVRVLRKSTPATPAANTHDLKVALGNDRGALLRALHLYHANITDLEVRKDGISLQDKISVASLQFFQNMKADERVTQAGLLSWDPLLQGDQHKTVPTLKQMGNGQLRLSDFEFKATTSAADNVTAYTDAYMLADAV